MAAPASGELTLETALVVRSDCDLTLRATGHKKWPASALLAPFGAVSNCRCSRHSQSAGVANTSAVRDSVLPSLRKRTAGVAHFHMMLDATQHFDTPLTAERLWGLRAALAIPWFDTIHPFDDDNGRIDRAIADWALASSENP